MVADHLPLPPPLPALLMLPPPRLHCLPSKFVSPPRRVVINVDNDRYCRRRRLPSPLPQSTTTTAKRQRLLFVVNGGDDNHRQLQRWLMAAAAMTSLPPPSTTITGWWPTARRCRHRRRHRHCCCHHTLALASTIIIATAYANVIAPLTLLSMVGCCVICYLSPAALSAVQICQPLLSCGALLTLFLLGRRSLLLTIASRCLLLFYRASIAFAAPVEGWLLRSPPAQQHTNHITKLKTFPVSTSWTYFDLPRVSTCTRMKNLRG